MKLQGYPGKHKGVDGDLDILANQAITASAD